MEQPRRWEDSLRELTPAKLKALVLELANRQSPDDRQSVMVTTLIEALTGRQTLGEGEAAWQAFLNQREAIRALVAQTDGLRYIEADG